MNQNVIRSVTTAAVIALTGITAFAQSNPRQTQNQQRPANHAGEASQDDLKVSREELHQEVTDAHKASKIIGTEVRNKQNERLGTIKDVVLDVRSGKVAYAVLSVGGFLGAGDKLVALPLEALTAQPGSAHFVIDANKDRLSQSSGFNDNDWPNLDAVTSNTIGLQPEASANRNRAVTPKRR